jgi:hypothetical protein
MGGCVLVSHPHHSRKVPIDAHESRPISHPVSHPMVSRLDGSIRRTKEARTSLTVECESSSLPLIGRVPHRSVCDIYLISSTDRRRCFATGGRLQLKHNRTSLRQHESVDHE